MSSDAIAFATLCVVLIGALVAFVRDSAVKQTTHEYRIKALEEDGKATSNALRREIEKLETTIERLTDTVNGLRLHVKVNEARQSQGAFSDSDRPERG